VVAEARAEGESDRRGAEEARALHSPKLSEVNQAAAGVEPPRLACLRAGGRSGGWRRSLAVAVAVAVTIAAAIVLASRQYGRQD
jgi:hypothetical protein